MSLPIQNANAILMAGINVSIHQEDGSSTCGCLPHPKTLEIPIALTIAQGTATAAFDASSLMWTLESNEPGLISSTQNYYET